MKAIVYTKYGSPDVLQLKEVEKPIPKENEVLVKVIAASANPADWHMIRGEPKFARITFGLTKPKKIIPGIDIAGQVEAVGKNVKEFQPGDVVFGDCGWGGAFAEYVCVTENKLVSKPANISFEEGATVMVAVISALQGLRDKGQIQAGQKVLINGASGGVGTFAVQLAKY
ncbi:MAG: NAD(P)-dependent alcohol dehydrogenase, partial [Ignavibacteriaceae bacterium]